MDYLIDLDPTHLVLRLTVRSAVVTLQCAEDVYILLARIAQPNLQKQNAPSRSPYAAIYEYAAIYDLTAVTGTTLSFNLIRGFARRHPSIPTGRAHVVVGHEPSIYRMARIFQMCRYHLGDKFQVVQTLEEAHEIVGVRPRDFTERVYPKKVAA